MSDRGVPVSPVHMNGYGSHTYSLWNDSGERFWVKFHFKTNAQSEEIIGQSRETYQEALFGGIEEGEFPRWSFKIQVMSESEAKDAPFNPFDLTKVWPHGDYPLIDVGEMELNRNPENYFAEIEQAAFSPSNVVPGISYLQARIFSYADAHRYRLGTHYEALPVNAPKCPVHHYHKDGSMNFTGQMSGNVDAYYEPNSVGGPVEDKSALEPALAIEGDANRYNHRDGNDDFSQPRALFELFDAEQKQRLFDNIAASMNGVPADIAERQCKLFDQIHPEYGAGVRQRVL